MPQLTLPEKLEMSPARRLLSAASHLEDAYEALTGPISLHSECVSAAVSEARYFATVACQAIKELAAKIDRRHGAPRVYSVRPDLDDHHLPCQQCQQVRRKGGKRCYCKG